MKPPGAMDAKRPGAFVSSDAGGTSNVNVGVTPAMLRVRPRSRSCAALLRETAAAGRKAADRNPEAHYTLENKHTPSYTRMLRTPYVQDRGQSQSVCETTSAKG